jgi:RNA polymerase sigma-70 factor, ECF subfamily
MDTTPDQQLVRRARGGSADAVAELFSRHWTGAWRAAYGLAGRRAVADDIAQDAFERAIRNLHQFDGSRPFAAWLHRIVVNRAHDVMRRERKFSPLDDAPEQGIADGNDGVVLGGQIRAALSQMGFDRRAVVVLHYWLGYPLAEIATLLEVPPGTVHSRLSRALAELRKRLEVEDAGQTR